MRQPPWQGVVVQTDETARLIQALIVVHEGGRRPELAPAMLEGNSGYATVLQQCWVEDPSVRPSFDIIVTRLKAMIAALPLTGVAK